MPCGCRGASPLTHTPEQIAAMEAKAEARRAAREERIQRREQKMAARKAARARRLGLEG